VSDTLLTICVIVGSTAIIIAHGKPRLWLALIASIALVIYDYDWHEYNAPDVTWYIDGGLPLIILTVVVGLLIYSYARKRAVVSGPAT
jgi:hypothetical protein